ncbi:hypothetical protein ABPG75_009972 [Micractinium tetrahymenae]
MAAGAVSPAEAAAQLGADLALLETSIREAAQLLDLAAWQLGELDRGAAALTSKTRPLCRAKESISAAKARSEEVLEHLDASRKMQGIIQAGPRAGLEAFLAALSRLEAAVDFLQAHRSMQSAEDALRHTTALRDSALSACAQEFSSLAHKHSAAAPAAALARARAAAAAGDSGRAAPGAAVADAGAAQQDMAAPLDLLPGPVLDKLRELAGAMLRGGSAGASGRAAVRAWMDARQALLRSELDAFLAGLAAAAAAAASNGSTGGAAAAGQLSWQGIEAKLPGWMTALRLFVRLAQEEARLGAAVFTAAEQAGVVSQVLSGGGASLLSCADFVLSCRRMPEKLCGLLEMHGAVEGALPALRASLAAVGGDAALPLLGQLSQLRGRLASEVRACFADLLDSLPREAAKGVPADGTVHPLCASAVSLLKRTLGYASALRVLFGGPDGAGAAGHGAGGSLAAEARLLDEMAAAVARIFDTLLAALDAKAKAAYKSRALAALHQMNNLAYIQHAMTTSRELHAVGEGWAERNKGKVEEQQRQYTDAAWGPLLQMLRQDARQAVPPNLSADKAARAAIKDKWGAVNKALAEAAQQQAWAVPDSTLRDALRDAVSDQLLPLYHAFYGKYRGAGYTDHHSKHEKYSPADLASLLGELFDRAESAGGPSGSSFVGRSPSRSPASISGGSVLGRRLSRLTSSSGRGTP